MLLLYLTMNGPIKDVLKVCTQCHTSLGELL